MPQLDEAYTEDSSGLTRWELNAFLAMSSLAGAFLMVIVSFLIPRLLEPVLELPQPVWFGLGLFVLMWLGSLRCEPMPDSSGRQGSCRGDDFSSARWLVRWSVLWSSPGCRHGWS